MKKVFVSQNLVEIEMLKERLERAGIPCTIKNQRSSSLAGEVPFTEVFPELWVVRDVDNDQALELIEEPSAFDIPSQNGWACAACGERHDGQFGTCWKCGRERGPDSKAAHPPSPDPDSRNPLPPFPDVVRGFLLGALFTVASFALWNYLSLTGTPYDRNGDGKDDVIYEYGGRVLQSITYDNNFDGFFETRYILNRNGDVVSTEIDRNRDGQPDVIGHNTFSKLDFVEILDLETGKVRKRMHYKLERKTREEFDQDGDGALETVTQFDEYENSLLK
jgi:hypothetical protein